ncbi:putative cytochrome P450 [Xylariomycetidae sp. FL0641]|nr:putative cytochrome P450 [Xylariomycetidae sp. FL0641]
MLSDILLACVVGYMVWAILCLEGNVRKARSLQVPIVRIPISSNNVLWILVQPHVYAILDRLPVAWSSWPRAVRFCRRGWAFADRADTHVELGPVFALVSPEAVNLHFADPETVHDVMMRRGDFQRPTKELKLLELYGPCISTAKWEDWPRHRRVMATPFNETIMSFVWDESLRQAKGMLRWWTQASSSPSGGIPSYPKDTRTLSLNVLAAAGFRKSYEFRGSAEPDVGNDDAANYRDALQTVLDNIILLMLLPFRALCLVPGRWARIGRAGLAFQRHMERTLGEETRARAEGKPGSGGIVASFVRAADLHGAAGASRKRLSVEEVYGNLFVINFAGHDTTANTLAFGMLLLASRPGVQAWLAEEIAGAAHGRPVEACEYKQLFPRLKRCRAVLYEVLRMYSPVPALISIARNGAHTLKVGGRTLRIPEGVSLTINTRAMQMHPKYWPDQEAWRPSRWIAKSAASGISAVDELAGERFIEPDKGIFFPWGDGPQVCPGKKFAEVEAVAVLARVFQAHRLRVKKQPGESDERMRVRVAACLDDCDLEMLTRMRDAERVTLICEEV